MRKYIVLVLVIVVSGSLFAWGRKEMRTETRKEQSIEYNYKVTIDNMTCPLCDIAVEKQLSKLDWIQAVQGDHTTGLALLKIDNPLEITEMGKIINQELDKIDYNFVKLRKLTNG